jgi:tetratricopeptide (TPR) repeat protein
MTFDDQVRHEEDRYLLNSPGFSAALSGLIMGLGQIFHGDRRAGLVFLFGQLSLGLYAWDHFYGHVVSDALILWLGEGLYNAFFFLLMTGGFLVWIYNMVHAYRTVEFMSFILDRHSQTFLDEEPELGVVSPSAQYGRRRGRTRQMAFVGAAALIYTISIFFLGSRLGSGGDGLEDMLVRLSTSNNPELHLNAAQFFYRLGRYQDAQVEYSRAQEFAHSGPQRRLAEMGLDRVDAALRGEEPETTPVAPPPLREALASGESAVQPVLPQVLPETGEPSEGGASDRAFSAPPPVEPGPEGSPASVGATGLSVDRDYALERAELEISLGNLDGAHQALRPLVEAELKNGRLSFLQGELARLAGQYDRAKVFYQRAIDLTPGNARAYLGMARLARVRAKTGQEEVFLRRAVVADPVFPEAVREYADYLAGSGRAQQAHEVVARALTAHPDDQDLLYRSFVYSRQAGNSERAFQAAVALARNEYREGEIYAFLARRALKKGLLKEAKSYVDILVRLEPSQEKSVLLQAEYYRHQRNPKKVIEVLRPWITSGSLETALLLGQAAKDARDYPVGIRALETALEVHPPDAGAWKLLGILRKRTGDMGGALEAYQQAIEIDPEDREALYLAGYIHFRKGDWEEGIRLYEKVSRESPRYGESDFYLAACYQGAGLIGKAIEAYQRVPQRSSNRAAALDAMEKLRKQQGQQETAAVTEGARLSGPTPRRPEPLREVSTSRREAEPAPLKAEDYPPPPAPESRSVSVDTYATILRDAEVAFQEGRFRQALKKYGEVLKVKPDHFRSHYQRGMILRELRRPAEAIEAFQLARAINPQHVKNLTELGQILVEETQFGPAVTIFEAALKEEPKNLAVRYKLGVLYEHQKNYAKAEEQYQAILWYHPEYTQAHEYLGNVYYRQSKYDRALRSFDALLKKDPKNLVVRLKRALTRLQLGQPERGKKELEALLEELPANHSLRSQVETYLASLKG